MSDPRFAESRPETDGKARKPARRMRRLLWLPWMFVIALVIGLTIFSIYVSDGLKARNQCQDQMRAIYRAIEAYDQAYGQLPSLSFYPTNPQSGEKSLRVALTPFGAYEELFLCPHSADLVREQQGLSYLWNVALNGKPLRTFDADTWILVEIEAVSADVSPPHFRRYNVLYANGDVRHVTSVPPGIRAESE